MASQGVGNEEPGIASAGGPPASQAEPEVINNSVYQPIDQLQNHLKEKLQAFGFIVSGSLSVAAGRKPTRALVQNTFGMNIASATVALVGFVFLSVNLAVNKQSFKNCESSQSQNLCIYVGIFSNGLMSLMLILTLLELCISISVSAMWCIESSRNSTEVISTPSNSVQAGMPPDENKSESKEIQA
ncbi:membrane-spanning 4-domains subfamily A member 3-like [Lutra lutra]|uniref:membrane-spanning 4-domains subfamily A member 3-like n=1 Tax=Lutra lutra TaxID=9657 RepID=UPI001FD1A122|nr:membrane-spanning 4-domains subfamily A member 3-like [Lutra lutra]